MLSGDRSHLGKLLEAGNVACVLMQLAQERRHALDGGQGQLYPRPVVPIFSGHCEDLWAFRSDTNHPVSRI